MKKNGFTLIELLVCFVLVTIISITLFKTVLSLQEKQKKAIIQNEYKAFALVLNKSIKNYKKRIFHQKQSTKCKRYLLTFVEC